MTKILATILASAVLLASCGKKTQNPQATEDSTSTSTTAAPVETKAANTDYKPAFEGQTRIAGVTTSTPYEAKILDSSLVRPWGIAALPDGRFLITEKGGSMRIAEATGKVGAPINGVPKVDSEGQGGLLLKWRDGFLWVLSCCWSK